MVYPRSLAPQDMKLCVFSRQLGTLLSFRTSGPPETQDRHPRNQEHFSPEPSISILDFVCRAGESFLQSMGRKTAQGVEVSSRHQGTCQECPLGEDRGPGLVSLCP